MLSPKFAFSVKSIHLCVSKSNIEKAWRKKVRPQLRKQVLWDLIEFRDIDHDVKSISAQMATEVAQAAYQVSKPKTYLAEKSKGLCRQMTLVEPTDLILLQCLSSRLHQQIVSSAPSKGAFFQPGDMKWSTGKMTISDDDYGAIASWKRFQKQVLKFSKENKYIVVTDVANFYDFINFKHLRNIVASICSDVDEALLDLLIHLLNELAWVPDYMPRQEMGMPQIETEAPRVLANAMLFELDRVVEAHSYKNYARFMDDIDFGTNSIVEAKQAVRDIDLTLQARQLRLNSAKTKILNQQEAYRHFCVSENGKLDRYANLIEKTPNWPLLKSKVGHSLSLVYENWYDRTPTGRPSSFSPFLQGNGSKVHKRIYTLIRKCGAHPPDGDLLWLVRNAPNMRSPAFRHLVHSKSPNTVFNTLLQILLSGTFVDDIGHVEFANFCVHARLKRTPKLLSGLEKAATYLACHGPIGLWSAAMVRGRFDTPQGLLSFAEDTLQDWRKEYWLARTIAGLFPRVFAAPGATGADYLRLVRNSDNQAAQSVLTYHYSLMNDPAFVIRAKPYLVHDNGTFPLKLYFPKSLQILSVKQNSHCSSTYTNIKSKHPCLASDPFFAEWGF